MKVVAFVPIKLNSERVVGKNLRPINGKPLLLHIVDTLLKVKRLDEIHVFCSSTTVEPLLPSGVTFTKRDVNLDASEVKGSQIYEKFVNSVSADVYVLAHATSPFIRAERIEEGIEAILEKGHDSALSVVRRQDFVWYCGEPLNYSPHDVPRTQDLAPVYVETSGFFAFTRQLWTTEQRRVGKSPHFVEVPVIEGIDIDEEIDFRLAELVAVSGLNHEVCGA